MIRDEMIFELQPLLDKAKATGLAAKKERIVLSGQPNSIDIEVIPVKVPSLEVQLLIIIHEAGASSRPEQSRSVFGIIGGDEKDRRISWRPPDKSFILPMKG
jgi:hypothetical protein